MQQYTFLVLAAVPAAVGALSGWMRYDGYHLGGQTRRELFAVAAVEACWEACLQEASFSCLSVAYSAVGSLPCRLYATKALSAISDWTGSADFTYYEYCGNGTWTWTYYPNMILDGQNLVALTLAGVDIPECLEACQAEPACASVDYRADNRKCFMNDISVLDVVLGRPGAWDPNRPEYDHLYPCTKVSYDIVYKPLSAAKDVPHKRFQLSVLHTNGYTDVNTLEVYSRFRCPLFCHWDAKCIGFKFGTTSKGRMTTCHIFVQI